ncbi:MAG: 2-oxoacid:acceptor oxidoreductase family protein [Actinomycetia bacterium]|nr:2-oxoacid:acceptor oxidoreductase family protein [Actinomycetes bacterium]
MEDLTEIRWHGRGGQGAVTAAKLVAEAALKQDKYFQASPEYGPERMGAPIQAFTRICPEPILIHCAVTNPDIVVVLDPTLLSVVNVTDGLVENGALVINTDMSPAEVRQANNIEGYKIVTVDASKIAIESIGRAIPNTPMLGAVLKATGIMDLEKVAEHIRSSFGKKFSQEIIDGNVEALTRAYQEARSE